MTTSRRDQAKQIRAMRAEGQTWAEVTNQVGVSETTGRKLLKEFEDDVATSNGRAAKVEPPAPIEQPKPKRAPKAEKPATAEAPKEDTSEDTSETEAAAPKQRSGRYLKLVCGCGHVLRASKKVNEAASVHCTDCDQIFAEAPAV